MDAVKQSVVRPQGSVDALVRLAAVDMTKGDALITERMDSPVPVIPALAEHLIAAGGKRLRPLLTVAADRLAGGRGEHCLKLAAAVEFIHTATLLHDDVVDGSQLRRGKVAAHLIWGGASSVLVGDFLFARAFELMVETGSLRALDILAKASSVIAEGEVMQQGGRMDELHRRRQFQAVFVAPAGQTVGGHGQQRAQALAARRDQVFGQGRDHRHGAVHALGNQGVDAGHVGLGQPNQVLDGAGRADQGLFHCIQKAGSLSASRPVCKSVGTMVAR